MVLVCETGKNLHLHTQDKQFLYKVEYLCVLDLYSKEVCYYRCVVCADYHLCHTCFATDTHMQHSFQFRQASNTFHEFKHVNHSNCTYKLYIIYV